MSFDWSDYLTLARRLVLNGQSEASLRSAISRAYYAAFCKARNHLRDKEKHVVPAGGEAHRYVRDQFQKSRDRLRREVGVNLNRLRIDRNQADYSDVVVGLPAVAAAALILAERTIEKLEANPDL